MPVRPCLEPGCPVLVRTGTSRCSRHERQYRDRYEALRRRREETSTQRGYGADWKRLRAQVLAEQPICPCGCPAVQLDHVVPLKRGGQSVRENAVALCKSCHSRKTAKRDGGFGR